MRQSMVFIAAAAVGVALSGLAESVNWVGSLGSLAQDPAGVRAMMEQVDAQDKQAFAERLLRAVNTMPLTQEEKNARIARIAHELVAGAKTAEEKKATLSTIFSKTDPTYLAGVSDMLAAGLDAGRNGLSQNDFLDVATNVIASVTSRSEGDPDELIRMTMATATFIRAAGGDQNLVDAITNSLGDSDFSGVVKNVVGPAAKGDYAPMLAANAAERQAGSGWFVGPLPIPGEPLMSPVTPGQLALGHGPGPSGLPFGGLNALPTTAPVPVPPYQGQVIR